MSRGSRNNGSVFKLSGNMALGGEGGNASNDIYSTQQLQSIKSSLRLLKARQAQKRSEKLIDINNMGGDKGGGSYSSNAQYRSSQIKTSARHPPLQSQKDYNYYQQSARKHMPSKDNNNNNLYNYQDDANIQTTTKSPSIYQKQRPIPLRNRNGGGNPNSNNLDSLSSMERNYGNKDQYSGTNSNSNYKRINDSYDKRSSSKDKYQDRGENNYKNDDDGYGGRGGIGTKQKSSYSNYDTPSSIGVRQKAQTRPPLRKPQQQANNQKLQSQYQQSQYQLPQQSRSNYSKPQPSSNNYEQQSLKQINRQQKAQIVEYDPSQFVMCSMGCGRKFNPDSISKHQVACLKVFQNKRKKFNAQEHRILDGQHKQIVKQAEREEKKYNVGGKGAKGGNSNMAKDSDGKMNKWKAQSLAFRAMLKNNKGQKISDKQQKELDQANNLGKVKCPHCGRSFNETAGARHITFCENQSKKNKFKK